MTANWDNQTLWTGDNLPIMRGMNSGSVDLIYLDPPFNSKRDYGEFNDRWAWDDEAQAGYEELGDDPTFKGLELILGRGGDLAYLCFMALRLRECRRLLKDTGSIYLHCDPTASHYLKVVMDGVFGRGNMRNELVWCYSRPSMKQQRQCSRVHDAIFWYTKGTSWTFNPDEIRQPYSDSSVGRNGYAMNTDMLGIKNGKVELNPLGKFPEDWFYIRGLRGNFGEYVGYPTQKPLALLERIIAASSNEGDVVLDPFCGSGTTLHAAQKLGRRWVGIDINPHAADIVQRRLKDALGMFCEVVHRTDVPVPPGPCANALIQY